MTAGRRFTAYADRAGSHWIAAPPPLGRSGRGAQARAVAAGRKTSGAAAWEMRDRSRVKGEPEAEPPRQSGKGHPDAARTRI